MNAANEGGIGGGGVDGGVYLYSMLPHEEHPKCLSHGTIAPVLSS